MIDEGGSDARGMLALVARPGDVLQNLSSGHRLTFRETARTTGGQMVEVEVVYERAITPPPPHFHPSQEEHYVGLEGEVLLRVDGGEHVLREGDELVVPRRAVHQVWAAGPGRALWQTLPALRTEQLLEAIWGVARDGHIGSQRPAVDPPVGHTRRRSS